MKKENTHETRKKNATKILIEANLKSIFVAFCETKFKLVHRLFVSSNATATRHVVAIIEIKMYEWKKMDGNPQAPSHYRAALSVVPLKC